mmetsp:Transcript_13514/g.27625  ORF Transcript_13514/g.27625 Transcript_13514/m.27625 type:complete len:416 (-) Transcript_13514:289-1536(-)
MLDMEEKVKREIRILKMFMHPHIVRLYEVIDTPQDIYVFTECCSGGELFDFIVERGKIPEDEARMFFQQIISGVEYIHSHMVAHRDLKPENLLLDQSSNVKIADFGLSNCMRDGYFLKTSCGSPNYAAPEVISGKVYAGPEVDVWSCGVIVYALLCGTLPFDDENIPYLFKKIKGGIYSLPAHLSELARDIIQKMLQTDPIKRITIPEIRRHPWFQTRLPRYLAMQYKPSAGAEILDEEVLKIVEDKMGFPSHVIARSIQANRHNALTVAYHLLRDSVQRLDLSLMEFPSELALRSGNSTPTTPDANRADPNNQWQVSQRWYHGIVCELSTPNDIMMELYRGMQILHWRWKRPAQFPYQIRVLIPMPSLPIEEGIRINFQLYKTPSSFRLDVHRTHGNLNAFLFAIGRLLDLIRV